MKKIKTVKTTTTLYLDYEYEYWDDVNPKNNNPYYRLHEDYSMLRKGAILDVYYENEYKKDNEIEPNRVICVSKNDKWISFSNLKTMEKLGWFKEVEQ